jgi:hypothetical protein
VVDERRFPVAGASVTLHAPGGGDVAKTTTGANGRFGFAMPPESPTVERDRGTLWATTADGRAGWARVYFDEEQLGGRRHVELYDPIVLATYGRLRATVRDIAGEVADASVELREEHGGTAVVATRTDEHGVATFDPAPVGDFALFAKKIGRGRASVETTIASGASIEAAVQLRELRSLAVEVVDIDDGTPVPGATLTVIRDAKGPNPGAFPSRFRFEDFISEPASTDANGRITLRDLEAESEIEIRVRAEHHVLDRSRGPFRPERPRFEGFVSADAGTARVELKRSSALVLRYAVDPESGPIPADGTRFDVELPREHVGCMGYGAPMANSGGTLHDGVLEFTMERPPNAFPRQKKQPAIFPGWAVAADGSSAQLIPSQVGDGIARFVPGASLAVTLVGSDGAPLADRRVALAYEARRDFEPSPEHLLWTDSNGVARFGKLWAGRWIATAEGVTRYVELKGGDLAVTLAQAPADEVVLQFVFEGERRLPPHLKYGIDDERISDRREEPATGDVHVFVSPARSAIERRIRLYGTVSISLDVPVPPPTKDHAPLLVPVATRLQERGTLEAHFRGGNEWLRVAAERFDEAKQEFVADSVNSSLPFRQRDANGTLTLRGLVPGKWRLVVADTEVRSESVEIAAGGPAARLEFDLTTLDSLPIFWKVPDGESRDFLEVGPSPARRPPGLWLDWESEWPLRASPLMPRDDGITSRLAFDRRAPPKLEARHPYLVPSLWNDSIDLTKPRSAITLHMEVGPLLTMEPEFPDGIAKTDGVFVTLIDPGAPPAPDGAVDVRHALRRGDIFAMAPPAAGERRMLIDPIVAAPVELASVVFDGGPRDLGAIRFARGSTLHVHARAPAPFAAPRVIARATRIGAPAYERASSMRDSSATPCDPEIRAIGAGRFRVEVESQSRSHSGPWTAEVEVDGVHDAELTILTD